MPKDLAVGLWTFDAGDLFSDGKTTSTKSIDERVAGLRSAAEKLSREAAQIPTQGSFDSILAAPEYLFSNRDGDGKRLPLAELERLQVEQKVFEVSRAFPRMVMVPGTLFYAKDLVRPEFSNKKFNPQTGLRDLAKTSSGQRRDKFVRKVGAALTAADLLFQNPDEREAVKNFGFVVGRDDSEVPSLSLLDQTLRNLNANPFVVRNTAYILLNGKRIAKYDKRADFGETRGASADDLAFVPGTTHQCPAVDGYRFGVEICYDHQVAALAQRNVPDLRFHILVSDATGNSKGSMAMQKGGYFLHASTISSDALMFFRKPEGNIVEMKEKDSPSIISCDELKIYRVSVPD